MQVYVNLYLRVTMIIYTFLILDGFWTDCKFYVAVHFDDYFVDA